jgi:phage terminase large subunit-like protein
MHDGRPWPTAGRLVGQAIQRQLVHGEGDALGDPVRLSLVWWYILNRIYEFDPETGRLAHDRVLILMGKGNAKTERIGELGDMELFGPVAPVRSPRVVLSAASYGQSIELFGAAKLGILGDPAHDRAGPLAGYFREGETILEDRILLPDGTGRLERTTTVGGTNDGGKPTAHLFDELHEYQTDAAIRLFIVGSKGIRKRRVPRRTPPQLGLPPGISLKGPILVAISTYGADRDSLLGRLYDHGVNVARGHDDEGKPVIDPGFLFLAWESDSRWDLDDPVQLRQAVLEGNPEAGGFLSIESIEASVRDPMVPRAEAIRYNLARWPDAESAWMNPNLWDATKGTVTLDPQLPVYAAVGMGHDHRSADVATAQRQGENVVLRVTHFPQKPLASGDYLDVEEVETFLTALRKTHPALVIVPRRLYPGGPEKTLPAPGPEIVYTGSFFEGSAQRLRAVGAAMVDIPMSPERLRPASETLLNLAVDGKLIHEADAELAQQVADVRAREAPTGWHIAAKEGKPTTAAKAAMVAVHRAVTAPRAAPDEPILYGSFRS